MQKLRISKTESIRVFVLALLHFRWFFGYAQQTDSAYYRWVYAKMREVQPTGTLYYSDKPAPQRIKYSAQRLPAALADLRKTQHLALTQQEISFLIKHIRRTSSNVLPDTIFPNSKRLPGKSIADTLSHRLMATIDSMRGKTSDTASWNSLFRRRPWAFTFTKPVYLRDKTLLVSYFCYYLNSSGAEDWSIYKRNGNNWERIAYLGGGAW